MSCPQERRGPTHGNDSQSRGAAGVGPPHSPGRPFGIPVPRSAALPATEPGRVSCDVLARDAALPGNAHSQTAPAAAATPDPGPAGSRCRPAWRNATAAGRSRRAPRGCSLLVLALGNGCRLRRAEQQLPADGGVSAAAASDAKIAAFGCVSGSACRLSGASVLLVTGRP